MIVGSDEYIAHAKKIKELSKKGYSPYVYIKINIRYLSRTHIRRQQRELIGFLVHRIDGHGSAVLRYEAPERHPVILELKVAGTPRLDCGYERIPRRRLQGDEDRHEQMHIVQQQRAGLRYAVRDQRCLRLLFFHHLRLPLRQTTHRHRPEREFYEIPL